MIERPDGDWVLRVRSATLGYGPAPVLAGVELEVHAGDAWFLIGPNGSGKTTLLKGILGLLRPVRGRIERHTTRAARDRLGFVPQQTALPPSLPTTIREFVSLGLVRSGAARGEQESRLTWALARVGLEGRETTSYHTLSGGQRRRALLARALVRRPALLVLDEPTEGLDVASEDAFLETLADLQHREGITLLVVTHKLALASRHASHVALFHDGRVETGPRDAMLRREVIERVFGLTPSQASAGAV